MRARLVSAGHNELKDILENLLSALVLTILFVPTHIWTTNFDNCYQRYIATWGKKIYVGAHLRSKVLRQNFLQISQLSTWNDAHNLFRRFLEFFAIFDRNLAKILSGFWSQRCATVIRAALDLGLLPSPVVIYRPQSPVCAGWLTSPVVIFGGMYLVLEMIEGRCWHLVAHEVLCSLTWNVVRGSQWPIFLLYRFRSQKVEEARRRNL